MHRVRAKVEAEKDKKLNMKRPASEDKSAARPPQRRRPSQQRGNSGGNAAPVSPTAISPRTTSNPLSIMSNPTASPTNSFTPVGVNGKGSYTPQSQTGSSPSSELVYPFTTAMGTQQGLYTPFGNSPPLFPVQGQTGLSLPSDMLEVTKPHDDDGTGQFWQSLFGPPGSSLPPHQYSQNFSNSMFNHSNNQEKTSPSQTQGEFRDPNNMDLIGDSTGNSLEDMDSGLVDWGDFIAQCSQVWVTE
jgi:hypothetical protein